ncbi:MAG: 2-dehydropantoate 2-reductase N-terminal domain-containing protein [Moraxellaceae bacterium]|nr:2-dehydropantoate 2-reductase N-terminal domain-containing protein [Moraxellaceae bacterium]MDZ4297158.1 2-dehydropantoate 2-reductase N-terminal domain-containing protein [Moraxellaceae bacterium]MDZ4387372.1 2-dehydropantoate 2-reductase N-terminal domain-containing protein [Moraxellaceae bacterium]
MKILVVGAGAVGQVYAWHLAQAGHDVSFFVKAKYAEALRSGTTLYRLGRLRTKQQIFRDFSIVTEPAVMAAQNWDQVWLALPSDAMRGELAVQILKSVGRATVISLQPDIEDVDYVRRYVPAEQVVQGLITFISYQSPLPDRSGPEGMAYFLPPLAPGLFGGEKLRVGAVVFALKTGGMSVKEVPDFAKAAIGAPAMLQPLIAALEVNDWHLNGFIGSTTFGVGLAASREALAVAEKHAGADIGQFKPLLNPWVWRLLLPLVRQILPFHLESLLRYHYGKVKTQSLMLLDSYIRLGSQHGLPTPALATLRNKLTDTAAA